MGQGVGFIALGSFLMWTPGRGWVLFELQQDGLIERRPGRLQFVPWSELERVTSRDIGHGGVGDRPEGAFRGSRGSTDPSAHLFRVMDDEGRCVFKIPPWTGKRRELVGAHTANAIEPPGRPGGSAHGRGHPLATG